MTDLNFGPGVARLLLLDIEAGVDIFEAYALWPSSTFAFPATHRLYFLAKANAQLIDVADIRAALSADVRAQINVMLLRLAHAARKVGATHRLMPHYCLLFHMPIFTQPLAALERAALAFAGSFVDDVQVNVEMEQLSLLLDVCSSALSSIDVGDLAKEMRPPLYLRQGEDFRDVIAGAMAEELRWVLEEEMAPAAFAVGRALCLWPLRGAGLMEAASTFYFSVVD